RRRPPGRGRHRRHPPPSRRARRTRHARRARVTRHAHRARPRRAGAAALMARRPPRDAPPTPPGRRDLPRPRPTRGGLGNYISDDGSAGRGRPLPAWLPEAPDPPVKGEESGVRLIPFDEVEATPPVSRREPPSNVRRAPVDDAPIDVDLEDETDIAGAD